eukprot:805600-Pelagomonas_calceolata.AAC.3
MNYTQGCPAPGSMQWVAACSRLLGCVATPHAHAGEAQAAPPPPTPLLCLPPQMPFPLQEPSTLTEAWPAEWTEQHPTLSIGSLWRTC